ncbi:MAG: adenosylmethionine decarboxylase [Deltaproteobacteria bacterium]|nr:adenosylmethionine decarboxylase [Deltaproteobacteria bacterium]
MKSLGKHLVIEFHDCDPEILDDTEVCQAHLLEAVRLSGATVIQPFFHKFSPHGVSGIVVIAESHFSVHTWPEYGYCAIDIFTCGDEIKGESALNYLREKFKSKHFSLMEIKRGLLDLPNADIKHKPETEHT